MKKMNNRAVSEMVAYVLLIVITISLSVVVYAWLKVYVIKDTPKCPDGIGLIIEDYSCSGGRVNITFENSGRFNIDGIVARFSNATGKPAIYPLNSVGSPDAGGSFIFTKALNVSEKENARFSYANHIRSVEVEPFLMKKGKIIMCDNAVISQQMSCD